jgi:ZIP family zinc transporter
MGTALYYMLMPMAAIVIGGALSALREPSAATRSKIQHFAAGVVLAAVAIELLPEIASGLHPFQVMFGFAVGVGLMVAVDQLGHRLEASQFANAGLIALMVTVGIDIFVDGLLVGVSFQTGIKEGVLITVALTFEVLFLSLATAASLRAKGQSRARVLAAVGMLAVLLGCSVILGAGLLAGAPTGLMHGVIAFAVAALLYLVVEELLVEAHKIDETPAATILFFAGFLAVMMLETGYDRLIAA